MNSNNSSSSGSTCSNTSFVGTLNNNAMPADGSQMKLNEQNNFDAPSYAPSSSNQPPQEVNNNQNQQNQEIDTFMNNFMDSELTNNSATQQQESQIDTKMVGNLGDSYPTQEAPNNSVVGGDIMPNASETNARLGLDVNSQEAFNNNIAIMSEIMPNASEVTTSSNYSGDNQQLISVNYSNDNNQQLPVNNEVERPQTFMTEKQMNDINKMADNMAAAEASEVQQQQQEQQTHQQSKLAQLMQQPYMSSSSSQLAVQRSLIQQSTSGGVEQPLTSSQPQIQHLAHPFTNAANTLPIQQSMGGQGVNNQVSQPIPLQQQQQSQPSNNTEDQPKELHDSQKNDEVISLGMGSWSDDDEIEIVDNPLKKKSKVSSSQSITTAPQQATGGVVMNNTPAWNGGIVHQPQKPPQSYVDSYNQARGLSAELQNHRLQQTQQQYRNYLAANGGGSTARTPSSVPPQVTYIQMPSNHTPTWSDILPKSTKYQPIQQQQTNTFAIVCGLASSSSSSSSSSITISDDDAAVSDVAAALLSEGGDSPLAVSAEGFFSSISGSSSSSSFLILSISSSSCTNSSISFFNSPSISISSASSSSPNTSSGAFLFLDFSSPSSDSVLRTSSSASSSSSSRSNAIPIFSFPSTNSPRSRNFFSISFHSTSSNVPLPMK